MSTLLLLHTYFVFSDIVVVVIIFLYIKKINFVKSFLQSTV